MGIRLHLVRCVQFAVIAVLLAVSAPEARRVTPDHLIVMVFDQMRPDYIDRFNLPNFKRLRASSRNYPDAYVGHLGSQTVVAHAVIPTGLRPGALPWQDEAMVDLDGVLGKPGAVYKTGELDRTQLLTFLQRLPRSQFLGARIRDALGGKVFAVGSKNYATVLFGGPHADAIVTLEKRNVPGTKPEDKITEWAPDGVKVPTYISGDSRFTVENAETYGTGLSTIYEFDGSHYVPGRDASRPGGDVWTADVAVTMMKREVWSAMFLTFGGIDKVAHMLGEQTGAGLQSVPSTYRLSDIARVADAQLGKVLATVDELGLADRTAIVVTADHGGQRNEFYFGNNEYQSCCAFEKPGTFQPPYWLKHLSNVSKLKTGYADTNITLWLAVRSRENEASVIRGLSEVPGVTEVFVRREAGDAIRYERVLARLESQSALFQKWARQHSAELVDTMAGRSSPDVVALLGDGFGFGRIGGHGGAQEMVQRIPLIVKVPGERASTRRDTLRLMDIAPLVSRILGVPDPAPAQR